MRQDEYPGDIMVPAASSHVLPGADRRAHKLARKTTVFVQIVPEEITE